MRNWQDGFSLVEMLGAIGIISLIIIAVATTFHYTVSLHKESNSKTIAINDAVRVAEQVRYLADTNGLIGVGSVTDGNINWTNFISQFLPNEDVQITWTGTNPLAVTITINWLEKQRADSVTLTTLVTTR